MVSQKQPTEQAMERARPLVYKSIKEGNIANIVKLFAAGFPPGRHITSNSITPLMVAATIGKREVLETIIAHGVDINQQDSVGRTALHFAC